MGQSDPRSVPLKVTSFTSPPVTNKGNRIRVLSPRALLQITVREHILFSFMEPVYMLLPVWPSPPPSLPKEIMSHVKYSRPKIETVAVERLIDNCQKTSDNRLTLVLPESPRRVLHCRVKNITMLKKTVPESSGSGSMATAFYQYDIEVKYKDVTGRIKAETFNSGIRCQQVTLPPAAKAVNISIQCACAFG